MGEVGASYAVTSRSSRVVLRTISAGFNTAQRKGPVVSSTRGRMVDAGRWRSSPERGFAAGAQRRGRGQPGRSGPDDLLTGTLPTKEDVVFPDHDGLLRRGVDGPARHVRRPPPRGPRSREGLQHRAGALTSPRADSPSALPADPHSRAPAPPASSATVPLLPALRRAPCVAGWATSPTRHCVPSSPPLGHTPPTDHVLRGWLRGEVADPRAALAAALDQALSRLPAEPQAELGPVTVVVTRPTGRDVDAVLEQERTPALLESWPDRTTRLRTRERPPEQPGRALQALVRDEGVTS